MTQPAIADAAPSPLYCKQCDYLLIGLPEHRCPECGQTFDPSDPATFESTDRKSRRRKTACRFTPWLIVLLMLAPIFVVVARGSGNVFGYAMMLGAIHVVVSGILSSPLLYFGRRRADWQPWELVGFIVPFCIWLDWMILDGSGKSLANLGEFIVISLATPLAVLVRVVAGARRRQWLWSSVLILLLCFVAAGTYLFTPALPE
jgi:rRNA maturation protein Nop10